jgi:hypothetical protein
MKQPFASAARLRGGNDGPFGPCSGSGTVTSDREIRDRTFENQSFRASGLSLITAAIVHWNMVYLDRAVRRSCVPRVG